MISIDEEQALTILKSPYREVMESFPIKKRSPYTYSRNVFLPLTRVCRNACGYCIFRKDVEEHNNILKK